MIRIIIFLFRLIPLMREAYAAYNKKAINNTVNVLPVVQSMPEVPTVKIEEKKSMNLLAIGQVYSAAQAVEASTAQIYAVGASMVDNVEKAYATAAGQSGTDKKAAVLLAMKAACDQLGQDWTTLQPKVSAWVDTVIAAYNALKSAGLVG